jgi:hypothetical protein
MPSPQDTGLTQRVYIAGTTFALSPATIGEIAQRAETAERMADTFTVIDRPYVFDGAPDVVQKFSWALAWPTVNTSDYNAFTGLEGLPGFFDFTMWKPLTEIFSGDGVRTAFRLLRRRADTALTPPAVVVWTPITTIGGAVVANPTFGTPDSRGTTPITFATPPAVGTSNIKVTYTPVFLVRVVDPKRDMSVPFIESRTMTLEEI